MWDYDSIKYLYDNYCTTEDSKLCEELKVTRSAIRAEASKLNLHRRGEFTAEEKAQFDRYGKSLGTAMIFLLPYRSVPEVKHMLELNRS